MHACGWQSSLWTVAGGSQQQGSAAMHACCLSSSRFSLPQRTNVTRNQILTSLSHVIAVRRKACLSPTLAGLPTLPRASPGSNQSQFLPRDYKEAHVEASGECQLEAGLTLLPPVSMGGRWVLIITHAPYLLAYACCL